MEASLRFLNIYIYIYLKVLFDFASFSEFVFFLKEEHPFAKTSLDDHSKYIFSCFIKFVGVFVCILDRNTVLQIEETLVISVNHLGKQKINLLYIVGRLER